MSNKIIFNSDKIVIRNIVVGMLSNNVYFIETAYGNAIIDPSCKENDIIEAANNKSDLAANSEVEKIILTHYHFDHVGAADAVSRHFGAETTCSKIDMPYITGQKTPPIMHRHVNPCEISQVVSEGDTISIGDTKWSVIATPGHTMGSICLYCKDSGKDTDGSACSPILLCGDTLFKYSCGRTDFPDSDPIAMKNSLAKLAKLPDNTLVLPGHEDITTIGTEKNFMLQGL